MHVSGRGVGLSLFASILFVMVPGYVQHLSPLDGFQVFAQRVLWSIPAVLMLVFLTRQGPQLRDACTRLWQEPLLLLALPLAALLMGVQWLLFLWAPLAGRMLDVSMGYFLLPLSMVVVGRVFYGERLRPLQAFAVGFAMLGVGHELWRTHSLSWVVLVIVIGYPPYFMLRRWMRLEALPGFVFEMLLLAPLACYLIFVTAQVEAFSLRPALWWLVPGLALLSSAAFAAMIASSRLLTMGLFGILSYVEPALLFMVSLLFLGESFNSSQWLTYLPIWAAVIMVGWDSVWLLVKQARTPLKLPGNAAVSN